jgi:3-oxoacyl-[acyl-carrier protein] reductase
MIISTFKRRRELSNESYLVVGGSKGIGRGIVERLVNEGHQVVVLSRSGDSIGGMPGVTHHAFDVTKDEIVDGILPERLSGLAYCPGSIKLRAFKSLKPEVFREDFELNVMGAIRILQRAIPNLKAAAPASILLFSTVAVGQGMHAHASIAVSKGAIEGQTRTLAAELSPEIRVNCLAPALTETSLSAKFFSDPEKAKALGEKYPLGRTGTVDDLASIATFLMSPSAGWITGQVIGVDGGMSTLRK